MGGTWGLYSRAQLTKVKAGKRSREHCRVFKQWRRFMTGGQTAYLGLVIAAFSAFIVVLFVTHIRVNLK
ncbi:hypothetical protein E1H18_4016 [Caulobacter sp. RHG1]|nr:hypothetical protein [Caulobacter sp. RHG1]